MYNEQNNKGHDSQGIAKWQRTVPYSGCVGRRDASALLVKRATDVLEGGWLVVHIANVYRQSGRRRQSLFDVERSILRKQLE